MDVLRSCTLPKTEVQKSKLVLKFPFRRLVPHLPCVGPCDSSPVVSAWEKAAGIDPARREFSPPPGDPALAV